MRREPLPAIVLALLVAASLAAWVTSTSDEGASARDSLLAEEAEALPRPEVTLAFGGDVHFEGRLARSVSRPDSTLGPLSTALTEADLAIVNLESALTSRGSRARKELETPSARYWFRSPPAALDVLARSGVDVVSLANNHAGDYGGVGVRDALRAGARGPVRVVGIGRNAGEAFRAQEFEVKGVAVAVLAADASTRESRDPVWAAGPTWGGIAAARVPRTDRLLAEVRTAAERADLVVVQLHWGAEGATCATEDQVTLAKSLADAGAAVVAGSHSHTLLGSGLLGDTYVNYGLGNLHWYHGRNADTGVLRLRFRGDELVGEEWVPGLVPERGGPARALRGAAAAAAQERWQSRRACTSLVPVDVDGTVEAGTELPPFEGSVEPIGAALASRMASSHDPAMCPVPMDSLRYLRVTHVGFDGRAREGELAVHADHADDLLTVFRELYEARWPIERMRLVSDYGGDDEASMAANNTSGFNCRRGLGQPNWSRHAFGDAVDLNPVQNPYVTSGQVLPDAGAPFAGVDRSPGAETAPGVIHDGDVVVNAFERIGWTWGGRWPEPDFQHFAAPE
ncbi:CapA family protein [Aeromicrobium sp. Marseille-Q0843]|uniref:CapA family protein n=1 Tax=Aeromicrobium phoceense TaxID=2754045 RepID=A0A838XKQ1_9ACTN|nr:CapA family protein [Aeromicrobium phoceense]MBA4609571.1 CapA family protein [Aeromicrobium phoceense]